MEQQKCSQMRLAQSWVSRPRFVALASGSHQLIGQQGRCSAGGTCLFYRTGHTTEVWRDIYCYAPYCTKCSSCTTLYKPHNDLCALSVPVYKKSRTRWFDLPRTTAKERGLGGSGWQGVWAWVHTQAVLLKR